MCAVRKAFTLMEILVAAGLLGLLLLGFLLFLLPTLKVMGRASAQTEVQQQALLAFERIDRELRTSGSTAVGVFSQSLVGAGQWPGLCLTPLQGVDGQGQPNWAPRMLAFWWDSSEQRLMVKTWPPKNPPSFAQEPVLSRPARLTAIEFHDLVHGLNGSERRLASGVTAFDVVHGGTGSALVAPLTLQIELQRQVGHEHEQFKFHKVLTLRTL